MKCSLASLLFSLAHGTKDFKLREIQFVIYGAGGENGVYCTWQTLFQWELLYAEGLCWDSLALLGSFLTLQ